MVSDINLPGHLHSLSSEQREKLSELWAKCIELTRNEFEDNLFAKEFWSQSHLENPKMNLLRFLRSRKWNPEAALSMLIESLRWRREYSVRKVFSEGERKLNLSILRSGKGFFWGYDKDNRLISYYFPRKHDMFAQPSKDTFRHIIYQTELGRRLFHTESETLLVIFDLKGITWRSLDLNTMRFVIRCFQEYYPESLGPCLILNAPWIFWGFYELIKPLLDPDIVSRIKFLEDVSQLSEYISGEMLLTCYGGSNTFTYVYKLPPEQNCSKPGDFDESIVEGKLKKFIESDGDENLYKEYVDILQQIEKNSCAPNYYNEIEALSDRTDTINWQTFKVPNSPVC